MKETGSSDSSVFGSLWSVSLVNSLDQIGAVRDAIATGNISTFDRTLGKFGDTTVNMSHNYFFLHVEFLFLVCKCRSDSGKNNPPFLMGGGRGLIDETA